MDSRTRNSLIGYLLLTFGLSSIFYVQAFSGAPLEQVAPPLMWMPALAAIVTQLAFYRTLTGLGWLPGPWRYLALAAVIPIAYCVVIYVPVWLSDLGGFNGDYLRTILPLVPLGFISSMVGAL